MKIRSYLNLKNVVEIAVISVDISEKTRYNEVWTLTNEKFYNYYKSKGEEFYGRRNSKKARGD